ncbi:hypothetical protein [Xenorhabdus mauleonii]|uniref:hypothetical protein n=1 Tax=Xenorhabdus mauleonii TaxID=351675 RepID=UPI001113D523|nr:hypothetical protein [Xenorhabdus mauleonii]
MTSISSDSEAARQCSPKGADGRMFRKTILFRKTMAASECSQQRVNLKGDGYIVLPTGFLISPDIQRAL